MPPHAVHFAKTRIAPTPSGYLHLGNVLSFAITDALAQKSGAKILLRIDDLDRARVNREYIQDIFDTLNFLQIPWDEGPRGVNEFEENYSQVHRMDRYWDALETLANKGLVFACTCSRRQLADSLACNCFEKRIPLNTQNASWRLNTMNTGQVFIKNYDGSIAPAALPGEMQNFVVRKKDGFPAYQLTSVIDDLYYDVDLIVRGRDLWASTIAQHVLAQALGMDKFCDISFYHHPLLMQADGSKLSKSAGATSVKYLRGNGKDAAGVYALIGNMLGIDKPVADWQQLDKYFDSTI